MQTSALMQSLNCSKHYNFPNLKSWQSRAIAFYQYTLKKNLSRLSAAFKIACLMAIENAGVGGEKGGGVVYLSLF